MKLPQKVMRLSPFSKRVHTMTIVLDIDDYMAWEKGKLIQHALPYLTPDEREFIMTGITPDEWNNAFNREDTREEQDDE